MIGKKYPHFRVRLERAMNQIQSLQATMNLMYEDAKLMLEEIDE